MFSSAKLSLLVLLVPFVTAAPSVELEKRQVDTSQHCGKATNVLMNLSAI